MFSKPIRAVFYILAQTFMKLYNLPAEWEPTDEHEEFTGADMMARIDATADPATAFAGIAATQIGHGPDNPGHGAEVPDNRTNVPTTVFAGIQGEPVYTDTDTGKGAPYSLDQLRSNGWDNEMLVEHGYATVSYPNAAPVVPQPPAPPTPPAAPSAPTTSSGIATPTPAATSGTAPMVDADGLPWDGRIHSSSKECNNDGRWKKKRGVGDVFYNQVRSELLQRATSSPFVAPPVQHAPLVPTAAAAVSAPATVPAPPAPPGNNTAAQAAIAQALVAAAADTSGCPPNGQALIMWASENNLGHLFAATGAHVGLPSFGLISQPANAHLVPQAYKFMLANKG